MSETRKRKEPPKSIEIEDSEETEGVVDEPLP